MISIILAAIIPVAHIWETNSIAGARRFYFYSAESYKSIETPNYVTNGLTHWWDGQINVRLGYHKDGNIEYWKDLVGNNDLLITSTGIFFSKKSLRCNNARTSGVAVGNQIPDLDCVTIEVCAKCSPADVDVGMYNILVCNGRNNSYYPTAYPHFVGFYSNLGVTKRFEGGPYFVMCGRSSRGIRCQAYENLYKLFGDGGYSIHPMFYLAYINSDTSQTTPAQPYYQPYWDAKIDYTRFVSTFESCINTFSESASTYSVEGRVGDSSSLTPDPNFSYFSIGGSRYYEEQFGSRVYKDTNFWHGDIYCVRVYNRELTSEERSANSKIDHERFYGAD